MQSATPSRRKDYRSRRVTSKRESPEERTYRLQYRRRIAQSLQTEVDGIKILTDILSPVQQPKYPSATFPTDPLTFTPSPTPFSVQNTPYRRSPLANILADQNSPPNRIRWRPPMTSPLLALEPKIRYEILKYALIRRNLVRPCYHEGNLEDAFNSPVGQVIDSSLLQVNKLLSFEASEVLYGENGFIIGRPDMGSWWLKKIGSNLAKLRALRIDFNSGIANNLNVSNERLWLGMLTWLAPRHQIQTLYLSFKGWRSLERGEERHNSDGFVVELAKHTREEIVSLLRTFERVDTVEIDGGEFLSKRKINRLLKDILY